jgi:hypothetical protein
LEQPTNTFSIILIKGCIIMTQENEQAQDASVVTDVQAKPVQAVNEVPAQESAPAQAPAPAEEQKLKSGDGCILIDPFNLTVNGSRVANLLVKDNQFIMPVSVDVIVHTRLYAEEVEVMQGIFARLKQVQMPPAPQEQSKG